MHHRATTGMFQRVEGRTFDTDKVEKKKYCKFHLICFKAILLSQWKKKKPLTTPWTLISYSGLVFNFKQSWARPISTSRCLRPCGKMTHVTPVHISALYQHSAAGLCWGNKRDSAEKEEKQTLARVTSIIGAERWRLCVRQWFKKTLFSKLAYIVMYV